MQLLKATELKPHPRNNEFFDDMTGEKWEEFLESIRTRGIIEPIIITHDKMIVSGHQRVRAAKELGIEEVSCDVHTYNDDDEILQDLLETNIRQRGNIGGSAKKEGLRIKELERIYGIRNGGSGFGGNQYTKNVQELSQNAVAPQTQSELAEQLGMSVDTLQRYKMLSDMIPELNDLVTTGIVTKTTALAIMKELSQEEQVELISSLDITKKITQREIQEQINKYNELKKQNSKLKSELDSASSMNDLLKKRNSVAEHEKELYKNDSDEYVYARDRLIDTKLTTDSECRIVDAANSISELNEFLQDLLQNKLAPIRYKDYIFVIKNNEGLRENFLNTLSLVKNWYNEMISALEQEDINCNIIDKNDMNIIDMEG